ncbi:MAG: PorT family protein [Bacteroidales bacterium]|nr:PorT family protein [Bacteroidales bacterium]
MAGLAASQVGGDTYWGFHKAGIFAGGFVNIQITDRSVVQMELDYIQKGSRHNIDSLKNDSVTYILRLNYVEISFMYHYIISNKFTIEAGLSNGILVKSYEEYNYQNITDIQPFRKYDFCVVLGLSYSLTEKLKVNIRTSNSLIGLRKNNDYGVKRIFDSGQYNDVLILSLFYNFNK